VIGGSTPAAISGTTGSFSGNLTVDTNTLFVDAANNRVGVGTSSPALAATRKGLMVKADTADGSEIVLQSSTETGATGLALSNVGDGGGSIANRGIGPINISVEAASHMAFDTNSAERARIDASGNFGIGTSSPSARLHVNGHINCGSTGVEYSGITGASTNKIAFLWATPNLNGVVDNVLSVVIGTASDYRLKANVTEYKSALPQVMNLRPVTYNSKELGRDECDEIKTYIGLIAHEVSELFPFLVSGQKDGTNETGDPVYQSINYAGLTPILVEAIQEQQAIIEQLKADVAALQDALTKIETLESRVAALEA